LRIKSRLKRPTRKEGILSRLRSSLSNESRYIALLRRIAPEVHEGFFQSSLDLIIEKD
jgi:hypothetical protein